MWGSCVFSTPLVVACTLASTSVRCRIREPILLGSFPPLNGCLVLSHVAMVFVVYPFWFWDPTYAITGMPRCLPYPLFWRLARNNVLVLQGRFHGMGEEMPRV